MKPKSFRSWIRDTEEQRWRAFEGGHATEAAALASLQAECIDFSEKQYCVEPDGVNPNRVKMFREEG
jgi:hypothetical protein